MRRRAFLLVLTLMIMALIATLGLGFVTSRNLRYGASARTVALAQAHELALAGMDDARVKIERDVNFPPRGGADQTHFSYTESVTDMGGAVVGWYVVDVNLTYALPPYYVVRVQSRGLVGTDPPGPALPTATCSVQAEFDVHPIDPTTSGPRDPNQYRIINWVEELP